MTIHDPQLSDALMRASATIRDLRRRLSEAEEARPRDEPLAVVGVACRLPGGVASPDEYWRLLMEGHDAVGAVDEWRWGGRPPAVGGGAYAGTVEDVAVFDPGCFGISDAEASVMDPQQRMVLTICWEALERWGRLPAALEGSRTGVFLGVGHQDYLTALLAAGVPVTGSVGPGNARSIVANRVSYSFGLRGPSIVVDTACSSSLVAVHLAAQSLRTGECSAAIAGGVNLILAPESTLVTGRALPLAPDGRTKTFDAGADGMVRGEGAAVVVLRRLSDALADGDHVHAVLLATGTNQDGRTNGLTAPSPAAQEQLLRSVMTRAGVGPEQVTYIETHGTGTPLGDPIEVDAIKQVYGDRGEAATCWLGSVKPNLGHLESAAGIASLLKAVLAVERGAIPSQARLESLNPEIRLEGTRFAVPTRPVRWDDQPRRAAVSSFGFGGTNAHVVLESRADDEPAGAETDTGPVVLPVSGRTPAALRRALHEYAAFPWGTRSAPTVAAAAARRRTHHAHRRAVVARPDALAAEAGALAEQAATTPLPGRTAFVFPGQGTAWAPSILMEPEVVAEALRWDAECVAAGDAAVSPVLDRVTGDPSLLSDTRHGQLALAVVEAAIAAGLRELGLPCEVVLGHSLGEVVAALVAGRLSRAHAARLIRARAGIHAAHACDGAMAALGTTAGDADRALRDHGDPRVGIAAVNSARSVVVAGPRESVVRLLATPGIRGRLLDTGFAFHSPALAGPAGAALPMLADPGLTGSDRIQLVSTVTGRAQPVTALARDHWVRNLTDPVLFHVAVTAALDAGVTRFVEVAPSTALATHVARTADAAEVEVAVLGAGRSDRPLADRLAETLARAWEAGAEVDWSATYPVAPVVPELPTTAFDRTVYWFADLGAPLQQTAAAVEPSGLAAGMAAAELEDFIRGLVADVAGFGSAAQVDPLVPATELDVESAELLEVKNRLEDRLGFAVPITLLLDGASIAELAVRLAGPVRQAADAPTHHDDLLGGRRLDDLSEQELDVLLAIHGPEGEPA